MLGLEDQATLVCQSGISKSSSGGSKLTSMLCNRDPHSAPYITIQRSARKQEVFESRVRGKKRTNRVMYWGCTWGCACVAEVGGIRAPEVEAQAALGPVQQKTLQSVREFASCACDNIVRSLVICHSLEQFKDIPAVGSCAKQSSLQLSVSKSLRRQPACEASERVMSPLQAPTRAFAREPCFFQHSLDT